MVNMVGYHPGISAYHKYPMSAVNPRPGVWLSFREDALTASYLHGLNLILDREIHRQTTWTLPFENQKHPPPFERLKLIRLCWLGLVNQIEEYLSVPPKAYIHGCLWSSMLGWGLRRDCVSYTMGFFIKMTSPGLLTVEPLSYRTLYITNAQTPDFPPSSQYVVQGDRSVYTKIKRPHRSWILWF